MGSSIKYTSIKLRLVVAALFLIFLVNYLLQHLGVSSRFSRNYLDDLLAMPIIFYLAQVLMKWVTRNKSQKLDLTMLVLGFLWVSISFEWILPKYFEHLTADFLDILCYAIGTVFFYFMNRD
jgi:hypothetical protein